MFRRIPHLTAADAKRFKSMVDRRRKHECWPFKGRLNQGYGFFTLRPCRDFLAHRIAFTIATGSDPGTRCVCHTCDNPPCCNPKHLFKATTGENNTDRHNKGRDVMPVVRALGEDNGKSKLTSAEVAEIRKRYMPRVVSQRMLAKEYGVTAATIWAVVNNRYWHHVKSHDSVASLHPRGASPSESREAAGT